MFKQKKQNPNFRKKDFFAVKKQEITEKYIFYENKNKRPIFVFPKELKNVQLPDEHSIIFVRSQFSRPLTDFIPENAKNAFIFCGTLKTEFILKHENKINGILMQKKYEERADFVKKKIPVKFVDNHSKILIFEANEKYYFIHGSGNPSINAKHENYVIEQSEEKYNAIKSFFENV